jgi:ribosome-associated protein
MLCSDNSHYGAAVVRVHGGRCHEQDRTAMNFSAIHTCLMTARSGAMMGGVGQREVAISTDIIRLGQFLKLADMVDVGSDVKDLLADGEVMVNGEEETRRGRQLVRGDVVTLGGESLRVA